MRKLDFYRYNPEGEVEEALFSLTLENDELTASNPDGEEYLSNLVELYEGGIRTRDAQLYVEKSYEELLDLLERVSRHPDFYTK